MNYPERMCPYCIDKPVKLKNGIYSSVCIRCELLNEYDRVLERNAEIHLRRKEKLDLENLKNLEKNNENKIKVGEKCYCKTCANEFIKKTNSQKYCRNPCKSKLEMRQEMTEQEKWISKKEPKKNGVRNDIIEYSFFRKKYSPGKQFTACRG